MGLAGLVLPHGRLIAAEQLLEPGDVGRRKALAEAALAAAKRAGASYCDVRIGRYLNQAVITREANVQNVTNSESSGIGRPRPRCWPRSSRPRRSPAPTPASRPVRCSWRRSPA
jgi:hypothetical protein